MCGIVGIYRWSPGVDRQKLEEACGLLGHRGPDATGLSIDEHVGLGHRRLSIIDLSVSANQPMKDASGAVTLIYNGEVYNYRELREQLGARGRRFETTSDTEVILQAYLEYGSACVRLLEGMFAFAIWDRRSDTLLLARDRLGIKPLYYWSDERGFAFASEIKALLALDLGPRVVDREALHDYLTFRYTLSPRTMFKGIWKLAPAHTMMVAARGRVKTEEYWSPDYAKTEQRTDADWVGGLRQRVNAAVRSHLVSDVPVGVLLSGGLDSSIVAAVMQAERSDPIKTFSVAFHEGGAYDERPYARKMARHIGSDHHDISLSAADFVTALPAFLWHMDEPVADPAAIPLYYVSKLAREHVTVVLSGEGSDELLGGYAFWTQFRGYERLKLFKRIPLALREHVLRRLNEAFMRSDRLRRYLDLGRFPLSAYGSLVPSYQDRVFEETDKRLLYRREAGGNGHLRESVEKVRSAYRAAERFEFLDQMLFVSMAQWLPEDLLAKADKMTMAHSLELRVPFLDHGLVEYVGRMPTALKVRKIGPRYDVKHALKQAFADMLPREIVEREKLGFAVPYAQWFRGEMRELVRDTVLSDSARRESIFDPHEVERWLDRLDEQGGVADGEIWDPRAKKVWSLFVFEAWRQMFKVQCAQQVEEREAGGGVGG
jgi:asparagine synthase (glutamine-hydrolysing)